MVTKEYTVLRIIPQANGQSRALLRCPFCQAEVWAYHWSLAGSGKKCHCGAKFNPSGTATKE
ncbi:hypothetical protein AVO42_00350 [Thiomicrospira sp. XS5]|nr:hypothetical protein AVO42_00350 [Thiomicrospira sp. XS5]